MHCKNILQELRSEQSSVVGFLYPQKVPSWVVVLSKGIKEKMGTTGPNISDWLNILSKQPETFETTLMPGSQHGWLCHVDMGVRFS